METVLLRNQSLWSLFETLSRLETPQEVSLFLRDLCTLTELKAMAERWEVVQLVAQEIPYREISQRTGASTTTVTRVAHWLHHGEGGYRLALEKLQSDKRPQC